LWGLDDRDFTLALNRLRVHEERSILTKPELDMLAPKLWATLRSQVDAAIRPDPSLSAVERRLPAMLDTLLLPYWKDRWFLFEVWTLIQPLRQALALGFDLQLEGAAPISIDGVAGTSWNLPTQKARSPVAIIGGENGLLVWFQRETARPGGTGHMEPDVRMTRASVPDDDVLIVECKDRVKYSAGARRVAMSYAKDSRARVVWVVNYLGPDEAGQIWSEGDSGQTVGVIDGFRPGAIHAEYRDSVERILLECIPRPSKLETPMFLVIDTSGSMSKVTINHLPEVQRFKDKTNRGRGRENVRSWRSTVADVDDHTWHALFLEGVPLQGAESASPSELATFVSGLPMSTVVVVVTDADGLSDLRASGLLVKESADEDTIIASLSDRCVRIVLARPPSTRR